MALCQTFETAFLVGGEIDDDRAAIRRVDDVAHTPNARKRGIVTRQIDKQTGRVRYGFGGAPALTMEVIGRLLAEHHAIVAVKQTTKILVPTCGAKRGHPVLFPWSLAEQVDSLAADEGVKALLTRHPVREIVCDDLLPKDNNAFVDVDTRADLEAL